MTVTADRADRRRARRRSSARPGTCSRSSSRAGWWKGELETNVTIDAEDLFLRHFLGLLEPGQAAATATLDPRRQRPDGSWATYFGGPGDLSTSVEAYVALRLAGDPRRRRAHARARRRSSARPAASSGAASSRACGSRCSASGRGTTVPTLPPEQILLPAARAALDLLVRLLGAPDDRRALGRDRAPAVASRSPSGSTSCAPAARRPRPPTDALGPGLRRSLDRARARLRPPAGRRRCAARRSARPSAGSSSGRSATAPGAGSSRRGSGRSSRCTRSATALDHPVIARALAGLDTLHDRRRARAGASRPASRRSGTRRSSVIALLDAGVARIRPGDRPRLRVARGAGGRRRAATGPSAGRSSPPGGFPFEFANENYPDVDDTAVVVLALRRAGHDPTDAAEPRPRVDARHAEPLGRLRRLRRRQREPPVRQARVLRLRRGHRPAELRRHRARPRDARLRGPRRRAARRARALDWLLRRAGARRLVVRPLGRELRLRHRRRPPRARRLRPRAATRASRAAVRWLERVQNPGGGFGEDLRSYRDRSWSGRGVSTASQTAWALLGLHAAGEGDGATAARARSSGSSRPSARRRLGRAVLHRHRLPGRLLSQLPPLPGRVPGDGARPDPRRPRDERVAARPRAAADRAARARRAGRARRCIRTGMGPDRARIAAARALAHDAPRARRRRPLRRDRPDARAPATCSAPPSSSTRTARGRRCPEARSLVAALRRRGLRVHVGPLASTEPDPRPGRAAQARADGALAVDMESAWLAAGAAGRPLAVVRVVADTAGRHLADPRMAIAGPARPAQPAPGGRRALRVGARRRARGRSCSPGRARSAPASSARSRSSSSRSRSAARPIYVRKQIVHNEHVVADLERRGAVFVEELDEVPDGATVVFSAHGVSPAVRRDAAGARARRDRRDLPARLEGARRGAPLRRRGQDDLPHRPRRPRGGRGHAGRGARLDPARRGRSRTPTASRRPTRSASPT